MARRGQGTAHGGILVKNPKAPRSSVLDYRGQPPTQENGAPRAIRYTVPGAPVGQNRNGSNRTRAYGKTPEQREFASRLAYHGGMARRDAGWETTDAPAEAWFSIYFASERPDTDSPVKALLDSLEVPRPKLRRPGSALLNNDRQVRRYHVERFVDPVAPRVEVRLALLAPVVELVKDKAAVAAMFRVDEMGEGT